MCSSCLYIYLNVFNLCYLSGGMHCTLIVPTRVLCHRLTLNKFVFMHCIHYKA